MSQPLRSNFPNYPQQQNIMKGLSLEEEEQEKWRAQPAEFRHHLWEICHVCLLVTWPWMACVNGAWGPEGVGQGGMGHRVWDTEGMGHKL